nr:MAG: hypothetical protein TU35_09405 [Thermoproteus sp. AZ2]
MELHVSLDRPLPKPTDGAYVGARILEALVEARLALGFLGEGLTRDAAGKAFQAWRALLAALLRLELDKLKAVAKTEEERRWLVEKAIPRVPTSRMKALSQMLEKVGHAGISSWTDKALDLHDYQYNGPDPDVAMSKYTSREEAAVDIYLLIRELVKRIKELKQRLAWNAQLEEALNDLETRLPPNTTA